MLLPTADFYWVNMLSSLMKKLVYFKPTATSHRMPVSWNVKLSSGFSKQRPASSFIGAPPFHKLQFTRLLTKSIWIESAETMPTTGSLRLARKFKPLYVLKIQTLVWKFRYPIHGYLWRVYRKEEKKQEVL